MGKASSAKKIKRVQQAGVSRRPGQRRALGFPLAVVGIVVVGSLFVFLARETKIDSDNASPTTAEHWHMPYGIYVCNSFSNEKLSDKGADKTGIHAHADGPDYVHVHPFGDAASGNNARLGLFIDQVGMELSDTRFKLPSGAEYRNGDKCTMDDKGTQAEGKVAVLRWAPQSSSGTKDDGTPIAEATIITTDLTDIRFDEDGASYVIAFAPEDQLKKIPPPASLAELAKGNIPDLGTTSAPDPATSTQTSVVTSVTGSDGSTAGTTPAGDAGSTTVPVTAAAPSTSTAG